MDDLPGFRLNTDLDSRRYDTSPRLMGRRFYREPGDSTVAKSGASVVFSVSFMIF